MRVSNLSQQSYHTLNISNISFGLRAQKRRYTRGHTRVHEISISEASHLVLVFKTMYQYTRGYTRVYHPIVSKVYHSVPVFKKRCTRGATSKKRTGKEPTSTASTRTLAAAEGTIDARPPYTFDKGSYCKAYLVVLI